VFPRKDGLFWGLKRWVTIFGEYAPKPTEMGVNRQFQAKTAKYNKMLSYRRETALQGAL